MHCFALQCATVSIDSRCLQLRAHVFNVDMASVYTFLTQSHFSMTLKEKDFDNNVGKGGNAGNQYFRLFSRRYLYNLIEKFHYSSHI